MEIVLRDTQEPMRFSCWGAIKHFIYSTVVAVAAAAVVAAIIIKLIK